jgi:hypothetical protein
MSETLKSYNTICGKEGKAYVRLDGNNEELFCAKSIEAKIEITKGSVKCIGRRMEGSKVTGMKGSGTLKIYYGTPLFSAMVGDYKDTGKLLYFDLVMENNDPASDAGTQTVLLRDCSPDGITLAKLDGDTDDPLDDEISFTFEDYEYVNKFN